MNRLPPRTTPPRRILLAAGVLALLSLPALAGETDRRLNKLEGDVDTLYRAVFQGQGAPLALTAGVDAAPSVEALDRMQALEDRLRDLTNQVEEQGYALQQIQAQMGAAAAQTATPDPLAHAQDEPPATGQTPAPSALGTPLGGGPAGAGVTAGQPAQVYAQAYDLYQKGQAAEAEAGFRDFLAQWPEHELSPNAKYWLAQSQMAKGDYEPAARTFAEGYQTWPKAGKAPDMLLGLAQALAKAGRGAEACTALTKLRADFAGTAAPALAEADKEAKRLACP